MKKLLLISNKVLHYRIRIYNAFFEKWQELGYEFHVASNEYQNIDFEIKFIQHKLEFGSVKYAKLIDDLKPDAVINFLHLKDKMIIPLTFYCRLKGVPMIYWNHGVNLKDADNKLKNAIFHFIHTISSAIILYSPDQLKFISPRNRRKTFIAYNTLSFEASDAFRERLKGKADLKQQYGIKEKYVLLYISRILPYKGLDILLEQFANVSDLALVVVGGGISDKQAEIIASTENFYYLGEKYGDAVDEIYSLGDLFSTPGHIGLALNQAFYWGLPVLVLNRKHAPEIYYMKNGENGFVLENEAELKAKVLELCEKPDLLAKVSAAARATYESEMRLEKMFGGFQSAVEFVTEKRGDDTCGAKARKP